MNNSAPRFESHTERKWLAEDLRAKRPLISRAPKLRVSVRLSQQVWALQAVGRVQRQRGAGYLGGLIYGSLFGRAEERPPLLPGECAASSSEMAVRIERSRSHSA